MTTTTELRHPAPAPAPLPLPDRLRRALAPGDRDLILVPRGLVVEARDRIASLETEVSRLKGTLAMTSPKHLTPALYVGGIARVKATGETGEVTDIFDGTEPAQIEVQFSDGVEDYTADELEAVA